MWQSAAQAYRTDCGFHKNKRLVMHGLNSISLLFMRLSINPEVISMKQITTRNVKEWILSFQDLKACKEIIMCYFVFPWESQTLLKSQIILIGMQFHLTLKISIPLHWKVISPTKSKGDQIYLIDHHQHEVQEIDTSSPISIKWIFCSASGFLHFH